MIAGATLFGLLLVSLRRDPEKARSDMFEGLRWWIIDAVFTILGVDVDDDEYDAALTEAYEGGTGTDENDSPASSSSSSARTRTSTPGGHDITSLVETAYQLEQRLASATRETRISDAAGTRLHTLLLDLFTSHATHTVLRDDALLADPPLPHPEDAPYLTDPDRAMLLRIVDARGRNRALVLGVAATEIPPSGDPEGRQAAFDRLQPVWRWLYGVAEALHEAGANAGPGMGSVGFRGPMFRGDNDDEQTLDGSKKSAQPTHSSDGPGGDIPVLIWSREWIIENSVAAEAPNFLILSPGDVPPGFPLRQMRRVRRVVKKGDGVAYRPARGVGLGKGYGGYGELEYGYGDEDEDGLERGPVVVEEDE